MTPAIRTPTLAVALAACLAGFLAAGCSDPSARPLARGDRLLGVGEIDAAIAEYKLAHRQRPDAPRTLLRLGHAYAARGDLDEALEYYEPLLARDSSYRHQVAADLARLAAGALRSGASANLARAVQPLLAWGPSYVPVELREALGRHYLRDGDYARALSFHLAVLGDTAAADPGVYYEAGRAYEELGGCARALPYFEEYMSRAGRRHEQMDSARWHYGNCLFLAADSDRGAGRPRAALEKLERLIRLGVPRTYMERAHFFRGELLFGLGDEESALGAYRRVLDLNPARSGPYVRQAEERIRQILFEGGP